MPSVRSILVPLDGTAFGEYALPAAVAIAQKTGAALELVHVREERARHTGAPVYDLLVNETCAASCQTLDVIGDRIAGESQLKVTLTCLEGRVTSVLQEHIAAERPDLVVMATHGEGGITRALIGSVADHIVRHSATPVLLVRPTTEPFTVTKPLFREIVVTLDGSAMAEQIIGRVMLLASPSATRFTLLHVVDPDPFASDSYFGDLVPGNTADRFDRRCGKLLQYPEPVAARLRRRGFETAVTVVPHRHVAQGILEHARDYGADLIALTTRGNGGLRRFVLGSVASSVIHHAITPLLVFHPAPVEAPSHQSQLDAQWEIASMR